jgi:hypothetical protein
VAGTRTAVFRLKYTRNTIDCVTSTLCFLCLHQLASALTLILTAGHSPESSTINPDGVAHQSAVTNQHMMLAFALDVATVTDHAAGRGHMRTCV